MYPKKELEDMFMIYAILVTVLIWIKLVLFTPFKSVEDDKTTLQSSSCGKLFIKDSSKENPQPEVEPEVEPEVKSGIQFAEPEDEPKDEKESFFSYENLKKSVFSIPFLVLNLFWQRPLS